jgi:hypothetical protein
MPLIVDDDAFAANSRPTAIAIALFTMRFMEQWKHDVQDYDRAMMLVAVVAITSERLLRTDLENGERRLAQPISSRRLAKCNISSIASATGINRETTRRKVQSLIEAGLLQRFDDGSIGFAPGVLQKGSTLPLVRRQVDALVRVVNELMKLGTLKLD